MVQSVAPRGCAVCALSEANLARHYGTGVARCRDAVRVTYLSCPALAAPVPVPAVVFPGPEPVAPSVGPTAVRLVPSVLVPAPCVAGSGFESVGSPAPGPVVFGFGFVPVALLGSVAGVDEPPQADAVRALKAVMNAAVANRVMVIFSSPPHCSGRATELRRFATLRRELRANGAEADADRIRLLRARFRGCVVTLRVQ